MLLFVTFESVKSFFKFKFPLVGVFYKAITKCLLDLENSFCLKFSLTLSVPPQSTCQLMPTAKENSGTKPP